MTLLHPGDDTAVFRPSEVRKLQYGIPKTINKQRFDVLFYTGCRYTELQECHRKYNRIEGNSLKVINTKALVKNKYRYVVLNNQGRRAVEDYFKHDKPLPTYSSWFFGLKRWCRKIGIDDNGVGLKSTRKTWESYLVTKYPEQIEKIFLSQGHTELVALKHYLTIPFSKEDKDEMTYYVEGW